MNIEHNLLINRFKNIDKFINFRFKDIETITKIEVPKETSDFWEFDYNIFIENEKLLCYNREVINNEIDFETYNFYYESGLIIDSIIVMKIDTMILRFLNCRNMN